MVATGAGFRGGTLHRPKNRWRQKIKVFAAKRGFQSESMWKKKVFASISGFSVSKGKTNKQMVSPQNGDTRGRPPPPPFSPLSDATEVATVTGIHFQNKIAINSLAYFTDFSFSLFSAYRSITKNNGNTHAISKLHSRAQEIAMFGLHYE